MDKFSHPVALGIDVQRRRDLDRITGRFGVYYRIGVEGDKWIGDRAGRVMVENSPEDLETVLADDLVMWREQAPDEVRRIAETPDRM